MRFLILAFLLLAICGTASARTKPYPLCKSISLQGGELLFLQRLPKGLCWEALNKTKIGGSKLAQLGNSYRFVYVFGGDGLGTDFDPIFNVKYREIGRAGDKAAKTVSMFREEMKTSCEQHPFGTHFGKHILGKLERTEIDAAKFDKYHREFGKTPTKVLEKFHIWFVDSRKICMKTDGAKLAKMFSFTGDFTNKSLLRKFVELITTTPAVAANSGKFFKSYNVEIVRGSFLGEYFTGSFSIPAGGMHEIEINDLSTYLESDSGRPRPTLNFSIIQN